MVLELGQFASALENKYTYRATSLLFFTGREKEHFLLGNGQ
jgi:hypothetical protein